MSDFKPAFKHEAPAFSDDGEAIAITQFNYPEADQETRARQQLLIQLLRMLPRDNVTATGQNFLVFLYLIGASECQNQSELARRMKLSKGRVSQLIKHFREIIAHEIGVETQSAKPSPHR